MGSESAGQAMSWKRQRADEWVDCCYDRDCADCCEGSLETPESAEQSPRIEARPLRSSVEVHQPTQSSAPTEPRTRTSAGQLERTLQDQTSRALDEAKNVLETAVTDAD